MDNWQQVSSLKPLLSRWQNNNSAAKHGVAPLRTLVNLTSYSTRLFDIHLWLMP